MELSFLNSWPVLLIAAVFPVVCLLIFIYMKDKHKEPKSLLAMLFGLGVLSVIPILIAELILTIFFNVETSKTYIGLFINMMVSVACVEEGFKWIFTKKFGYDGKEFDEIYDIIVYSVFVSLGFACIENILYVVQNGFGVAVARALTSIPGHTCFAISMGIYLSKAKIANLNCNTSLYKKNMFLSYAVSVLLHTTYNFLAMSNLELFYVFTISMIIYCFCNVNTVSKMQVNFSRNVSSGNITNNNGSIQYNPVNSQPVNNQQVNPQNATLPNFCPVCGTKHGSGNFCGRCGFKFR